MYSDERLNDIYDRTDGKCHICREQLKWKNYGQLGELRAWEVDHSNPRANGGSDRLNNLYAACIPCNRSKGSKTTRSQRRKYGHSKAPISRQGRIEKWTTWFVVGTVSIVAIGLFSSNNQKLQNSGQWKN